jgi:hypothetical protein
METGAGVERVDSEQWAPLREPIVASSEQGALELGALYFSELRRITGRLVRHEARAGSSALLLGKSMRLFVFGAPKVRVDGNEVECRFPIVGGLLVARPGGALRVVQRTGSEPQLGLLVTDYLPRLTSRRRHSLRRWIYANVQRRLHAYISSRFLDHVAGGTR